MQECAIVWFKRDLRTFDHKPLTVAAKHYPVLPLYVFEPELWQQPDTSQRHFAFTAQAVACLNQELNTLGQPLIIKTGDVIEVLDQLRQHFLVKALYSHEETGNDWTFQRDLRVKAWCKELAIPWREYRQFGVIRGLSNRENWAKDWHVMMSAPIKHPPPQLPKLDYASESIPDYPGDNHLASEDLPQAGYAAAKACLDSFLQQRGRYYQKEMSSPLTAMDSCSRLSVYLTYGCISMREIYQTTKQRITELRELPAHHRPSGWLSSLNSFNKRLHWHCHFIQKLESEPRLEFENLLPSITGLRENEFNHELFIAWKTGNTGFPFIDACMRQLIATGWINFRVRALLACFSAFHLWLHWREPALHLAQLFTDYEPGIHYSQFQMQSGTTGINALRVYNPVKQSIVQDPEGEFIRRWIPELSSCPTEFIHEPWLSDKPLYTPPIVDHIATSKLAKDRVYKVHKSAQAAIERQLILARHVKKTKGKHD